MIIRFFNIILAEYSFVIRSNNECILSYMLVIQHCIISRGNIKYKKVCYVALRGKAQVMLSMGQQFISTNTYSNLPVLLKVLKKIRRWLRGPVLKFALAVCRLRTDSHILPK